MFGGHGVERDAARVAFRRADDLAVDRDVAERGVDAADRDVAAFALVRRDGDAGDARQRLGGVLVRQLAGVVGRHRFLDRLRRLLVLQRRDLRQAEARDRDLLDAERSGVVPSEKSWSTVPDSGTVTLPFAPGRPT